MQITYPLLIRTRFVEGRLYDISIGVKKKIDQNQHHDVVEWTTWLKI